jgi:DNA ligase (NAD+)
MKDEDRVRDRILLLMREIARHQDLYYKKSQPEISDGEYDVLFDELLDLERRYPHLSMPESPTKRVGSDLDNDFPEVPHPVPMLSLDKVYTVDELTKWIEKVQKDAEQSSPLWSRKKSTAPPLSSIMKGVFSRGPSRAVTAIRETM